MRLAMGLIVLSVGLSGCATVMTGTDQTIAVSTAPVSGATCTLFTSQARWTLRTPGSLTIPKSGEDLHVVCRKAGYADGLATIPSGLEGWTWGNVLNAGTGVVVDAATGAANAYPDSVRIPMAPAPGGGPLPDIVPMGR